MSPEWLRHPNAKALVRAADDSDPYSVAPKRDRLSEIAQRMNEATPGPWAWANTCEKGYGANVGAGCFGEDDPNCTRPLSGDLTDSGDYYVDQPIASLDHQKAAADAQFIAHSREDVPWLLARIAALEAALAAPRASGSSDRE